VSHDLLPLAPRDTPSDAKARKAARKRAKQDPEYMAWLHTQPSVVSGQMPVEAHHFPYRSSPHWHDRRAIPLTAEEHRGKYGFHTLGKEGWERHWKVDTLAEIERLNRLYEEQKP